MKGKIIESLLNLYAFTFGRKLFSKINRLLFIAGARGLGICNFQSPYLSGETPFLKKYLSKFDTQNYTILDVGANVGEFALEVLKGTNNIKVISFEANPNVYAQLTKNLSDFSERHILIKKGLSNKEEKSTIYDNEYACEGRATIYKGIMSELFRSKQINSYPIDLTTLDNQIHILKNKIFLLKIDVEGHERKVLLGSKNFLEIHNPSIIIIEFNEMNIYSKTTFYDIKKIIGKNYEPFRLLPGGGLLAMNNLTPLFSEIYAYQNIAFLSKEFIEDIY